jgi:hypothetical protein
MVPSQFGPAEKRWGKAGTQTSLPRTRFPGLAKQTWSSNKISFCRHIHAVIFTFLRKKQRWV